MQQDCDFQSVKRMLENNPALSHYYQRKISPFVTQLQRELSIQKVIKYPKLDIREFANNFDVICTAYELNRVEKNYYQTVMKQLNMAIYFSEKNKDLWTRTDIGVDPNIYDIALSMLTTKKLDNVVESINGKLRGFYTRWGVRLRDLEDCKEIIQEVSKDTTSTVCVKLDSTDVDTAPYESEFGNY